MQKVFYCPSCGFVRTAEEADMQLCPQCGAALYRTEMDRQNYIGLTDEERAAVKARWEKECTEGDREEPCDYRKTSAARASGEGGNGVAAALKLIAFFLYVCAVLAFFILVSDGAVPVGLIVLVSGLISGTMFLGFSEIIRLLDVISKKERGET
jgi:hypothetical protein